ncbi:MAG: RNA-binding transcriptional accessory protein [Desulfobacterales bacterium]|uniref:RNA-binding transcriptional accessory protein n=1 Tax=Candidatus Desulfatibia profunda TaxID=2841695 RepID=A0A8J6TK37_9BACT|nr:RNA-binding transcriptional accessory protein [Candidatus Desulfatibia profunda]MBL7180488.1 RNA-binding transcriptional accessory protein [Desulfobacterales bacterium]
MNDTNLAVIAAELELAFSQVYAVADLLAQDATVPFIARYRKEATGSLDEIAITAIRDRIKQLEDLDRRKEAVIKSLVQHGHLTDELKTAVLGAQTLSALEDIYLPYRPKRRTKATIAREKGLEPLARIIFEQTGIDPDKTAADYIDLEKGVDSVEDALWGARDVIAEIVNEDPRARAGLRQLFIAKATFQSKVAAGMEVSGAKFKDYFDWQEPAATVPSHRILAMRRGEKEDVLNLSIAPPEEDAIKVLEALFVTGNGPDSTQVNIALLDSYKRLLSRSMETEIRLLTKERADAAAIKIFSDNLRQLLLAPLLGAKRVMGIDPGFRTGCKIVCLDRQGKLLHHDTIYPHLSENQSQKAAVTIRDLCNRFNIEAIAVGNGTAGRETETFIDTIGLEKDLSVVMVNESGASVYSASEAARQEFPDLDLTVRGAISIGRRLMDPLSELVKIDPKSIGVGQYQHDVDQTALKQSLDDVVTSCVNAVGVDVNRASIQLLTYVSGLGPQLAKNIVAFRNDNGPFGCRNDLKKVPRLGPKAFEQCAGFLRITGGENPLDASAVHPESYPIVDAMAADLGCAVAELINKAELRKQIDISRYVTEAVGIPTLNDILAELSKPGRDPRVTFEAFKFAGGIEKIADLKAGMILPGIVTNVTAFGAFVDIGVHQDGLVHISELADRYVKDPATVVKVYQKVSVRVIAVDLERNRISLSMKTAAGPKNKSLKKRSQAKPKPQKTDPKIRPFHNPFADIFKR